MSNNSPLERYLLGFRLNCVAEGRSPKTILWYDHKLHIFRRYLAQHHGIDDATAVTAEEIRAFLVHLREEVHRGDHDAHKRSQKALLSPQTIQGYYRAIKAFFSWMIREEYLENDPTRNIRRPKAPQTIVPTFDEEQVRRLLAVPDRTRPTGFRDYCILMLLLDTGVRLNELAGLRISDLHLEDGLIQVYGKGNKERMVPVGSKVRKLLWRYLAQHRPEPIYPEVQTVFLTPGGRPIKGETVYRMVVRRGRQAGLEGVRCSPHTFRHTFAVSFLRNGGDVFSLQRILGHTSLVVTRMYCQLSESDIQAQHRRCSPVDRMG